MLKLEKLELLGFKSFHDRTEVQFDAGVTAVVGPNGCGKSNILDAMTWVLGEQSIKSLRGSSSEDLIFNGTQTRKRLGMAEVTLRLRATNGDLPDGQQAVAVTRRLFRSGENEYLLNGAACRLKDIHDLLYGSGLGVKGYSFMEQGKIGAVLQAKPLDRRALIEEAAGITRFRAKKREAELKLEAAQQNLVRVHDIVAEVDKQLGSLKRQAAKARRYERVRGELQAMLRRLYAREARELHSRRAHVEERFRLEASRRQQLVEGVSGAESELEGLRLAIEKEEAASRGTAQKLHEAELEVDRNRTLIATGRLRLEELDRRQQEIGVAAIGAQARRDEVRATLSRRLAEAQVAAELEEQASAVLAELLETRHAAEAALGAAESRLEDLRAEMLQAVHCLAESANSRLGRTHALESMGKPLERIAGEIGRLDQDVQAAEQSLGRASESVAAAQASVTDLAERVRTGFEASARTARGHEETRVRLDALRITLGRREERARACARVTALAEDAGEAVAAAAAELGGASLGLVADHIDVEPDCERAVEAALDGVLASLVVEDSGHASRALARATSLARGTLRLLQVDRDRSPAAVPHEEVGDEVGVVGRLADLVRVRDGIGPALRPWLEQTVVVRTLEDAWSFRRHRPWLDVVTLKGEVLLSQGLLRSGTRSDQGLLALRREARELSEEMGALEASILDAEEALGRQAAAAEQAERDASEALAALHEAEKLLVGSRLQARAAEDDLRKASEAWRAAGLEREALEGEFAAAGRELEQERARESELAGARAEVERAIGEARSRLDGAREYGLARDREVAAAQAALARGEEVRKAADAEAARFGEAVRERQAAVESLELEAENTRQRVEALAREVEEAEECLSGLLADVAALQDRLRSEEEHSRVLRHELTAQEGRLKDLRFEAERQRERVQEVEIERTRLEGETVRLEERCQEDLEQTVTALLETADDPLVAAPVAGQLEPEESEESEESEEAAEDLAGGDEETAPEVGEVGPHGPLEELRALAQRLKLKLHRLGPVNVDAIAEYDQLRERHDFLSSQASDLTQSIDSLVATIARINRTSRERFLSTFEQVNRNFQENFIQLFGGGRAELRLTDEENMLETGVDIVAQPPGKRLQNILLLSGGEKALTAISLLFALFRYKPSPFCILDEVDAPLDEKNIDRFLDLLRSLSVGTQFILITHSQRTMRVADTLYGVTMEEPGVSRLVSVKLE